MRKVTFTVYTFTTFGGIEMVLLRYLRSFDPDRWQLRFLVIEQHKGQDLSFDILPPNVEAGYIVRDGWCARLDPRRLSFKRNPIKKLLALAVEFSRYRRFLIRHRLRQQCRDQDVVVDFDGWTQQLLGWVRAPKVIFFHGNISDTYCRTGQVRQRMRRSLADFARIVLVCQNLADQARALWPALADRITYLYNPVDIDALRQQALESDPEVPAEPFIVAVVRFDEPTKGTAPLLRAYHRSLSLAAEEGRAMPRLVLVGAGPDEPQLRQLADTLGLADHLTWAGFKANPMPWIKAAILLVLSSKHEGFEIVLVEAQVLGVPCLSTDCEGPTRCCLPAARASSCQWATWRPSPRLSWSASSTTSSGRPTFTPPTRPSDASTYGREGRASSGCSRT